MDNRGIKCDLCKITLGSKKDLISHVNGKKHQKILKTASEPWIAQVNNELEQLIEKTSPDLKVTLPTKGAPGIFVTGFPSNIDKKQLIEYFSSFGDIQNESFGKNNSYVIIHYANPSVISNVVKRVHWFLNYRLVVEEKNNFRAGKQSDEEDDEKQQTEITNALKNIKTLEEQLRILQNKIQPDFSTVMPSYNRLCTELYQILSKKFRNCEVFPFGSTITGLSFKSSDVDVYVSNVKMYNKNSKSYLYCAKDALQKSGRFINVIAIPQAKIPIVRCLHRDTKISCDINFKNKLGVYNSNLINQYLSMDVKLKPLMILIKYWAKVFKLTGQTHLIKNYALSIMFVFFLQNPPFNLPSVYTLQKNSPKIMEESWNAGFGSPDVYSLFLSTSTSLSIFKSFLQFYISYNYNDTIICPFLGKPLPKEAFTDLNNVPKEFECYKLHCAKSKQDALKIDTDLCVQDPFEHTRNVSILQSAILEDFIDVCKETLRNLNESKGEEDLLYNLFTFKYLRVERLQEFTAGFSIAMRTNNLDYLKEAQAQIKQNKSDLKMVWFQVLQEFLKAVLKCVLKFNITDVTDSMKKSEENVLDVVKFDCKGNYNLWKSRGNLPSKSNTTGVLQRETEISNKIFSTYCNNNPISGGGNIEIEFEILLLLKSDPTNAVIKLLEFRSNSKCFKSFAMFFMTKFPLWFELHQNELQKSTNVSSDSINEAHSS